MLLIVFLYICVRIAFIVCFCFHPVEGGQLCVRPAVVPPPPSLWQCAGGRIDVTTRNHNAYASAAAVKKLGHVVVVSVYQARVARACLARE